VADSHRRLRIGVVVPILLDLPRELFASVFEQTRHNVHWHLHCHSDDTDLELRLADAATRMPVTLHLHRRNRGIARSWNDGIVDSYLDGTDLTLVVNDDIAFHPGGFDEFVAFLTSHSDVGLGFLHGFEAEGSPHRGEVRAQDFACFGFGLAAFTRLGAFDENFFPAYSEDTDYFLRAKLADVPIVVDGRTLVDHARNKSGRHAPGLRERLSEMKTANSAYFRRKWGGDPTSAAYSRPFNDPAFSVEIPWERRRRPYGNYDRPELAEAEPPHRRLISESVESPDDLLRFEQNVTRV
jgi:glycosyltransferase involved in cell wall biosynthesis